MHRLSLQSEDSAGGFLLPKYCIPAGAGESLVGVLGIRYAFVLSPPFKHTSQGPLDHPIANFVRLSKRAEQVEGADLAV